MDRRSFFRAAGAAAATATGAAVTGPAQERGALVLAAEAPMKIR